MHKLSITIAVLLFQSIALGQVHINLNNSPYDSSALLQISSSDKGFLMPGLTYEERDYIYQPDPAEGLIIYNTQKEMHQYYNGSKWRTFGRQLSNSVRCGNDMIDARDGNVYGTVWIGNQCWMSENLNHGTFIDTSNRQTQNSIVEKYCYGNDSSQCRKYGGYYEWDEAMMYSTTQPAPGICPSGWHIPQATEWNELITFLGGTNVAGNKVKQAGFANWDYGNDDATNGSGFNAIGAGYFSWHRTFVYLTNQAVFWTSDQKSSSEAKSVRLSDGTSLMTIWYEFKYEGLSIRCIKD